MALNVEVRIPLEERKNKNQRQKFQEQAIEKPLLLLRIVFLGENYSQPLSGNSSCAQPIQPIQDALKCSSNYFQWMRLNLPKILTGLVRLMKLSSHEMLCSTCRTIIRAIKGTLDAKRLESHNEA